MTKNGLRGFAAGILVATAVFAFFFYLIFNGSVQQSKPVVRQKPLTEAAVTQYLTNHHRKAIDIDAYNQWQAQNKPSKQSTPAKQKKSGKTKTSSKSASKTTTYEVTIKSGMMPNDISSELVSAKILKSSQQSAFDSYLHKNHLEKYVQLGKFKVSSDMSIPKLAQVITKNHTN
ncbi:MAG: hypothetical protein ABF586_02210 [Sporolactobacillus sp.]